MSSRASGFECINHPERNARGRCTKCGHPFCEPCLAFAVDGSPWCEPCGNALLEDVKPRWGLGGLVLGSGFGLTTTLLVARVLLVPGRIPGFLMFVFLGYAASVIGALKVALDRTTGSAPTIERRDR